MTTLTSWLQMQTLLLLRQGTDLGPVLGSDARLPQPPRCDLCGDEPVLRGRLVRLGGVPVVREHGGLFSFWTDPIVTEDDRQVATYVLCATCWGLCSARGRAEDVTGGGHNDQARPRRKGGKGRAH
jgi:hypothetical protein